MWRPPAINVYTQGMPEELIYEEEVRDTKGSLSKTYVSFYLVNYFNYFDIKIN